jgi:NADH-quinone oxidoreductase subunit J
MERIVFYILAFLIVSLAIMSITTKKLYRATMYLLFVLVAISGIYFLMEYNFMGAVQLSVYAGGIMVLFIYAVLLTDQIGKPLRDTSWKRKLLAGIISLGTAALSIYAIITFQGINKTSEHTITNVEDIGLKLLSYEPGGFVLPFEVVSILLLAAMIGAIVIAKAKKLVNQENN